MLSVVVALVVLLVFATTVAGSVPLSGGSGTVDRTATVLLAGVGGMIAYLVVGGVSGYFEDQLEEEEEEAGEARETGDGRPEGADAPRSAGTGKSASAVGLVGKAAFFVFLYLEVIDASFSFDGVVGAFAITNQIFQIALGLGIGALYIRSLTVYLVRKGTLEDYVYLEHGAHYAIGALAIILLLTIKYEINEVVTGLVGVVLILTAYVSSVLRNRRLGENSGEPDERTQVTSGV